MQESATTIAKALELRFSCTNPPICGLINIVMDEYIQVSYEIYHSVLQTLFQHIKAETKWAPFWSLQISIAFLMGRYDFQGKFHKSLLLRSYEQ